MQDWTLILPDHHVVRSVHSTSRHGYSRRRLGISANPDRLVSKIAADFAAGIGDHCRCDLGALPLWGIYDLIGVGRLVLHVTPFTNTGVVAILYPSPLLFIVRFLFALS
jgi:hypothetical protein